ncbi:MAG TPA: AI-2E family transporter [Gemmatimonadaceae bacterium]|nr:AI-2E family transporter [Gemmatimonadaceae bacterium]
MAAQRSGTRSAMASTTWLDRPRDRARLALVAIAVAILWLLWPYVTGIVGGAAMAAMLLPAQRRFGGRRAKRVAATLVVGAVLIIVLPAAACVVAALAEAPETLRRFVESDLVARLSTLRVGSMELGAWVSRATGELAAAAPRQLVAIAGSVTNALLNLLIAAVLAFYILVGGDGAWRLVSEYLPFSSAHAAELRRRFVLVTESTILGSITTAVAQAIVVAIGFAITGLPDVVLWGVVTVFASLLPVLGSALVWVPGTIALVVQGRPVAALTLGLIGFVVASNIDNVLRPIVNKRVSRIHPLVTLVGAFAGVHAFGVIGVLLGPLLISFFLSVLAIYRDEYGGAGGAPPAIPVATRRTPAAYRGTRARR